MLKIKQSSGLPGQKISIIKTIQIRLYCISEKVRAIEYYKSECRVLTFGERNKNTAIKVSPVFFLHAVSSNVFSK